MSTCVSVGTPSIVVIDSEADEAAEDYRLDFELDGALYKMVRNIVGAMFEVSTGELNLDDIDEIFAHQDRRLNPSRAAPAAGLTLEHVYYDDF